jgi:ubiquinone/menaquinone biosynthesis C-methylase UbiE
MMESMTQKKRESSVDWETDIYAKGLQLNRWPFSDVVSAITRATSGKKRDEISILEVGCGTGNNIWFFAEEGYKGYGIDMSSSAIEYGKRNLARRGLDADVRVGDISALPWADSSFDIVLDRGALTQNDYGHIEAVLAEVLRVLKPGGKMFCFTLFGMQNPGRELGSEVSKNTYDRFSGGLFSKVGLTSFFTASDLRHLFGKFSAVEIHRHVDHDEADRVVSEIYTVMAEK